MDAASALQPITNHAIVRDRQSGQNRGGAEAFRRALQEQNEGGSRAPNEEPTTGAKPPVRTALQKTPLASRQDQQARHIDVLA